MSISMSLKITVFKLIEQLGPSVPNEEHILLKTKYEGGTDWFFMDVRRGLPDTG